MFYDKSLMNSEMLGNVWKLANNMSTDNIEQSNLPKICNELDSWVNSEAVVPRRRLSLRASSHLIGGAAELYKRGVHKLFDDINKLDDDIIWRRKRGHFNSPSTSVKSSDSSKSVAAPEQMRRKADVGFDSSISPNKKGRVESKSLDKLTPNLTMSKSSIESVSDGRGNTNKGGSNSCSNNNCDLSPEKILNSGNKSQENQRKDKEVQTSPILISRGRSTISNTRSEDGFDRKLPFGYILIHDSFDSRIPSKIIFTSINGDVKNLI